MGCDIHMFVENKRTINGKERWTSGDYFTKDPYEEGKMRRVELHGHRNYQLFSTLAGVRDYSEKIIPVSEPKGIPDDCCEYVSKECDEWGSDGHSHSFLTLGEIRSYIDEGHKLHFTGLISPEQAERLDNQGERPESWCQGTSQKEYVRREWSTENETLIPIIEKLEKRYIDLNSYGWGEYDQANDDKIRIVFWFDN